jgi:hypothetical protein
MQPNLGIIVRARSGNEVTTTSAFGKIYTYQVQQVPHAAAFEPQ